MIRPLRITAFMWRFSGRNIDFQSVRPAEMRSAEEAETAEKISAGRTGRRPMFRSCCDASAQIENRHPHRESVGDLFEDHALRAVGQLAVDLDATIDRTWMHDQAIGLEPFAALFRQA